MENRKFQDVEKSFGGRRQQEDNKKIRQRYYKDNGKTSRRQHKRNTWEGWQPLQQVPASSTALSSLPPATGYNDQTMYPCSTKTREVLGNLEGRGDRFPNTSRVLVEYGHSPHHQLIYRDGSGRIDSVKINPSLMRMRECLSHPE